MPSKKEIINYYEKEYVTHYPGVHIEDSEAKASQILSILDTNTRIKIPNIVELGCGTACVSKSLTERIGREASVGCDISKTILRVGKKVNKSILLINADCEKVPIKSDSIELVLLIDVLEHLEHPEKAIAEASRISKKLVVIRTPIEDCIYHKLKKSKETWRSEWKTHAGHLWKFNMPFLLRIIDQNGLKTIQTSLCKRSSLARALRGSVFARTRANILLYFLTRLTPSSLYYRLFPGETLILCAVSARRALRKTSYGTLENYYDLDKAS